MYFKVHYSMSLPNQEQSNAAGKSGEKKIIYSTHIAHRNLYLSLSCEVEVAPFFLISISNHEYIHIFV